MTAKWVLVIGTLYLLDGGLIRSWGDAVAWPLIGIVLYVPFGIGVAWYPNKDRRVELTPVELRVGRKRLPMESVNLLHVARCGWRGGPPRTTSRCPDGHGPSGWCGCRYGTARRSARSSATRPHSPGSSATLSCRRAAGPTPSAHGPRQRPARERAPCGRAPPATRAPGRISWTSSTDGPPRRPRGTTGRARRRNLASRFAERPLQGRSAVRLRAPRRPTVAAVVRSPPHRAGRASLGASGGGLPLDACRRRTGRSPWWWMTGRSARAPWPTDCQCLDAR